MLFKMFYYIGKEDKQDEQSKKNNNKKGDEYRINTNSFMTSVQIIKYY